MKETISLNSMGLCNTENEWETRRRRFAYREEVIFISFGILFDKNAPLSLWVSLICFSLTQQICYFHALFLSGRQGTNYLRRRKGEIVIKNLQKSLKLIWWSVGWKYIKLFYKMKSQNCQMHNEELKRWRGSYSCMEQNDVIFPNFPYRQPNLFHI